MKQIVKSGVDFEGVLKERQVNQQKIPLNLLYQILREEDPSLNSITLDEVKAVVEFVKEKSGADVQEMGRGKTEELDV